jgi:hypothetical protein
MTKTLVDGWAADILPHRKPAVQSRSSFRRCRARSPKGLSHSPVTVTEDESSLLVSRLGP